MIKEIALQGLFKKYSYVDCSQIFKCDRKLLESLIDTDHQLFKDTDIIGNYDKVNILDTIKIVFLKFRRIYLLLK